MNRWIFGIILYVLAEGFANNSVYEKNITTCREFGRDAVFFPHRIIDAMWKIFFFWATNVEVNPIKFTLADDKVVRTFKKLVSEVDPHIEVPWHDANFLMQPRPGITILFLNANSPGLYKAFIMLESPNKVRPRPQPMLHFSEVQIKLVGRYIGMMACEEQTAYAMARRHEMPHNESDCEAAAKTIGYYGHRGYCYLDLQNGGINLISSKPTT